MCPTLLTKRATPSRNIAIWPEFLISAVAVGKSVSMINPARWIKGGSGTGLTGIRKWILNNSRTEKYLLLDSENVFPGTNIMGGVSIEVFTENGNSEILKGKLDNTNEWVYEKHLNVEGIDIPLSERDRTILVSIKNSNIVQDEAQIENTIWKAGQTLFTNKITSFKDSKAKVSMTSEHYSFDTQRMYRDPEVFLDSSPVEEHTKVHFMRSKQQSTQ